MCTGTLSRVDPTITRSALWLYSSWRWTVQCSRTEKRWTALWKQKENKQIIWKALRFFMFRIGCTRSTPSRCVFLTFLWNLKSTVTRFRREVKANAKALADTLMGKGHKLASDGLAPREQRNIVKPLFSTYIVWFTYIDYIYIYIKLNVMRYVFHIFHPDFFQHRDIAETQAPTTICCFGTSVLMAWQAKWEKKREKCEASVVSVEKTLFQRKLRNFW